MPHHLIKILCTFSVNWSKFLVGSTTFNTAGRNSNVEHFTVCSVCGSVYHATGYSFYFHVILSFFNSIIIEFCICHFRGRSGFMTPIFYYHFITMRYSSRRNPYTRKAFTELRMATEVLAARSPAFIAKILRSCIGFVCRLCPQPVAAPTAQ